MESRKSPGMSVGRRADHSHQASASSYRIAVGLLLVLITYGSLYPLTWNFEQPQDFIFYGPVGMSDLVENIVLFLPLGWLLAWHYHGRRRQWVIFGTWFLIALVVASVLQWLQKYLPRTPAFSDIVFNMVGYVTGWWAGLLSVHSLNRVMLRHQGLRAADRFALLMVILWLVAELFPLIPTLDVSSVAANVKSLWQQDPWQPGRMLMHLGMTVMGLDALAHLARSVSGGHLSRLLAGLASFVVLTGKFVVISQSPGLAVVVGILGGGLLWLVIDQAQENQRFVLLLLIAMASYLVYALAPYEWRETPKPMKMLPFASSLQGSIESVLTSVAFECLCFGAIIWSAVRSGGQLIALTLFTAVLAFVCEWVQRYLPGRTSEITSVLLALGMGWLVSALRQAPRLGKTIVISESQRRSS